MYIKIISLGVIDVNIIIFAISEHKLIVLISWYSEKIKHIYHAQFLAKSLTLWKSILGKTCKILWHYTYLHTVIN